MVLCRYMTQNTVVENRSPPNPAVNSNEPKPLILCGGKQRPVDRHILGAVPDVHHTG